MGLETEAGVAVVGVWFMAVEVVGEGPRWDRFSRKEKAEPALSPLRAEVPRPKSRQCFEAGRCTFCFDGSIDTALV